ncbi:Coatomer subunit epsilon [Trichinella pseudospiralis]|uniref:Coatomer subunit epsilon n=1 Tax=Trichinella pseudospiralis TaxID=6337 RepID=A0A0V1E6Y5_TRIPS|nr:Coatomer subunit epsilon [Trichinella pseudospiralis]KRZ36684.1 Coatomer subunit epsilon [Trichinella pseudospiralis]KRZ36685.1 Coatomer subunit epsilon [Trichinella pseudospiralis]
MYVHTVKFSTRFVVLRGLAMTSELNCDAVFEMKNLYYTGNYYDCSLKATKLKEKTTSIDVKLQCDYFIHRSNIAQGMSSITLADISASEASPELFAVRMVAEYLERTEKRQCNPFHTLHYAHFTLADIVQNFTKIANRFHWNSAVIFAIAKIFHHEQKYEESLRYLHVCEKSLDCLYLTTLSLLAVGQVVEAKKTVAKMHRLDDDNVIAHMASAAVKMFLGNENIQDAFYIFKELQEKYGSSALLQNALLCCFVLQGKYDDAEEMANDNMKNFSQNPEVFINAIVVSLVQGKSYETVKRYVHLMKEKFACHPWTTDLKEKENEFDKLCETFTA